MEFFQQLGAVIEDRWRAVSYNEERFPTIAAAALREADAVSQVDPWDVIRWLHRTPQIPTQFDLPALFGNPPVTLFFGPRFFIDLYYWLDGTTDIHRHSFSGAFQVLRGASVHGEYRFDLEEEVNPHFLIGKTVLKEVKILQQGEIQEIHAGDRYIHSLFHLDRPSVSLVVRTPTTPYATPLYSYRPPHFAVNAKFQEPITTRRLQSVNLLLRMHHPEADAMIHDLLAESDLQFAFQLLTLLYDQVVAGNPLGAAVGQSVFDRYLDTARQRHGVRADLILQVLTHQESLDAIAMRRSQITDADHRFFLALLMNVGDRQQLLALIRQQYPDEDPVDRVLDWMDELGNTRALGSREATVLGLPALDEPALCVFGSLLRGESEAETLACLQAEMGGDTAENTQQARELIELFRASPLFRRILSA